MLWYLAAPYSSPYHTVRQRRAELTAFALGWLIKQGELCYAPTVMTHPVQACTILPASWDFWRGPSFDMLDRCDGLTVLTLPGWRESVGVTAEIERALAHGKPVRLMSPLPSGGYALSSFDASAQTAQLSQQEQPVTC